MRDPIARRLLMARNDARQSGLTPIVARINPQDDRELEMWIRTQNRSTDTGLPPVQYSKDNMWGMKVVVDEKIGEILHLEFAK